MVCPSCGAIISENLAVCPVCGAKIEDPQVGKTKIVYEPITPEQKTVVYTAQEGKTVIYTEKKPSLLGWLVVVEGEPLWEDYRLPAENTQLIIGSLEDAQIQIKGANVEKHHVSIRIKDGKVFITDLDTEAGTFVNDQPVIKKELEDGDVIRIGQTKLKFRRL
ncbi:FHA domain-containing protein [Hydrogenobacter thermophilus]|uniref:FHA domain-containing protein n=1 Tax=Hydrogenobacter thermophilus TaxID=940 RepID=UPI0030FA6576